MSQPGDPTLADRLVGGRYRITALIAAGGMGEVYRAHDTVLDRPVALKVLLPSLAADPGFLARFRAEATNAARLSHPNVVSVYDFGREPGGAAYMAMELVAGPTLREILRERGHLPPPEVARIGVGILDALEAAHRAGIVHRDVKPENVLLAGDGRVKVADFGISRAFASASATQAGTVLGTPSYLAPEQIDGRAADERTDLYAAGIVLFEMLTGHPPFTGETPIAVASARLSADVPAPGSEIPGVPAGLDEVVRRATARDPASRFSSARAMMAALAHLAGGSQAGGLTPGVPVPGPEAGGTRAIPFPDQVTARIPDPTPPPPRALPRRRDRSRRHRRRRMIGALVTLLLAGLSIPAFVATTARVEVPEAAGLERDAALAVLEAAGLRSTTETVNDPGVAQGVVIRTDPTAGAAVRRGSIVTLVVSLGPVTVIVPDVAGMTWEEARAALGEAGLGAVRVDRPHQSVPAGSVVTQQPAPNVVVPRDSDVTVEISTGPDLVEVPEVTGDRLDEARGRLEDAGLRVSVTSRHDDEIPEGRVIAQDPAAGVEVERGSEVHLVASEGPEPVTVPDLECMRRGEAEQALRDRGLETRFEGEGRRVVDQEPSPGTEMSRGDRVTVVLGRGAFC